MGFIGQVQRTNRRFSGSRPSTRRTAVRVIASRPVQRVVRSSSPSHIAHGVLSSHGVQRAARGGAKQVRVQRQTQAAAQRKSQQQSQRKQIAVNLLNQSSHGVRLPKTSVPKTVFNTKIGPTGIAKQAAQQAAKYQPQQSSQVKVRASRLREQAGTSLPKPKLSTTPPKYGTGKNQPHPFKAGKGISTAINTVGKVLTGQAADQRITGTQNTHALQGFAKMYGEAARNQLHPPPKARYYMGQGGPARQGLLGVAVATADPGAIVRAGDYLGRPYRTVAGSINAALKGQNIGKHALANLTGKESAASSDILGTLGVKNKLLRYGGGFVVDNTIDPLNHIHASVKVPHEGPHGSTPHADAARAKAETALVSHKATAAKAKKSGDVKAAQKAIKKVAKAVKKVEHAKAEQKNPTRGVSVGVHAKVPLTRKIVSKNTSGRASAALARKAKQSGTVRKAGQGARQTMHATVSPATTPPYRTRAQHTAVRVAQQKQRATQAAAEHAAANSLHAFVKAVPSFRNREAIQHAIETDTISSLPKDLQGPARAHAQIWPKEYAKLHQAGLLKGPYKPREGTNDPPIYVPHQNAKALDKSGAPVHSGGTRPGQQHSRELTGTVRDKNANTPGLHIDDPAVAGAIKQVANARAVSRATMWRTIVQKTSEPFHANIDMSNPHARVYEVTLQGPKPLVEFGDHQPRDLNAERKVLMIRGQLEKNVAKARNAPDRAKAQASLDKHKARFVVMDRRHVNDVLNASPAVDPHSVGRVFDKVQGVVKHAMTVNPLNPGFQVRNFIGDATLGWQAGTSARNYRVANQVRKAIKIRNKALADPAQFTGEASKTVAKANAYLAREVTIGGKKYTLGQLADTLEGHALNAGQYGYEVRNQVGGVRIKTNKVVHPGTVTLKDQGHVNKFNQARENLPRTATVLHQLSLGKSLDEAQAASLKTHIDYGERTAVEKNVMSRVFPFYTFWSRNVALQAKHLFASPGKAAVLIHALDESAKAAGYDNYLAWAGGLSKADQQGFPFPLKVGDKTIKLFLSPPQADLNTLNPADTVNQIANHLTFFKLIPELLTNYSLFFRGQIQNPDKPLVPAPAGVGLLPGFLKQLFGVHKYQDPKTRKMIWGWNAKADYALRALPQSNAAIGSLKPDSGGRGTSGIWRALSYVSGIRVGIDNPQLNQINHLYTQRTGLLHQLNSLHQRIGKSGANYIKTPETIRLQNKINAINKQIGQAQIKQGTPAGNLPPMYRPPKPRAPSSSGDGTGGSGAGDGTGGLGTGMSKTRLHGPGVKLASLEAQYVKGVGFVNPQAAGQLAANAGAKQARGPLEGEGQRSGASLGQAIGKTIGRASQNPFHPGERYTAQGKVKPAGWLGYQNAPKQPIGTNPTKSRLFAHPQRKGAGQLGRTQIAKHQTGQPLPQIGKAVAIKSGQFVLPNTLKGATPPLPTLDQIRQHGLKDPQGKVVLHPKLAHKLIKALNARGFGNKQIAHYLTHHGTKLKTLGEPAQLVAAAKALQHVKAPTGQKGVVYAAAKKHGVPPQVLWGVYGAETRFGALKNNSSAGAQGPFQFLPGTADSYVPGGRANIQNFPKAAEGAAKYLRELYNTRGHDWKQAAAGYNAGGGVSRNPAAWPSETKAYVPRVMQLSKTFGKGAHLTAKQKQAVKIVERAHKAGQKIPKNLRHFVTQNMPTPGVSTSNPTSTSTSGVTSTSSPSSTSSTSKSGGKVGGAGPTSTAAQTTAGFTQQELQALQLLGLDPSVLSSLGLQTGYSPSTGSMKLPKTAPVRVRALSKSQEKSALV